MLRRIAVVHAEQVVGLARWLAVLGRPGVVDFFEDAEGHYHFSAFLFCFCSVGAASLHAIGPYQWGNGQNAAR